MSNHPLPKFHEQSSSFPSFNGDGSNHQGALMDHGTVVAVPVPTTITNNIEDTTDNSIPITALVLGLASAVCFVLMIIYIVLKVHCFSKKRACKKVPKESTTTPKALETGTPATGFTNTAFTSSVSDLTPNPTDDSSQRTIPRTFRVHSIDFNHKRTAEPTLNEAAAKARLTGARFLPGHQ